MGKLKSKAEQIVNDYTTTYNSLTELCNKALQSQVRDPELLERIKGQHKRFVSLSDKIEDMPVAWKYLLSKYSPDRNSPQPATKNDKKAYDILYSHAAEIAKKSLQILSESLHKPNDNLDNRIMYA